MDDGDTIQRLVDIRDEKFLALLNKVYREFVMREFDKELKGTRNFINDNTQANNDFNGMILDRFGNYEIPAEAYRRYCEDTLADK